MDRTGGMAFSTAFALLGWIFGPFDTQPVAAFVVAIIMSAIGLGAAFYYACKPNPNEDHWR